MRWLLALVLVTVIWGCDRSPVATQTPAPATAPSESTTSPATNPIAGAEPVYMLIDQRRVEFPPAKLRLRERGGAVTAILHSDDPKDAIQDKYAGNSFYFDMLLDIPDPGDLSTSTWVHKAHNSERADTVNGIFLEGRRFHLQPSDVTIEFDGQQSPVIVRIRGGRFFMFEADSDQPVGQLVIVNAEFPAELTRARK